MKKTYICPALTMCQTEAIQLLTMSDGVMDIVKTDRGSDDASDDNWTKTNLNFTWD